MIEAGERLAIRSVTAVAAAIGFTGTRFGMTQAQQDVLRSLLLTGSGKLHHGDCVGADEQAHDIARALGRTVVIHPASLPDQRAFKSAQDIREPKAPLVRNKVIVRETTLLIAAPAQAMEKHRSGTWSTVRFARKMGRAICILRPDGTLICERDRSRAIAAIKPKHG